MHEEDYREGTGGGGRVEKRERKESRNRKRKVKTDAICHNAIKIYHSMTLFCLLIHKLQHLSCVSCQRLWTWNSATGHQMESTDQQIHEKWHPPCIRTTLTVQQNLLLWNGTNLIACDMLSTNQNKDLFRCYIQNEMDKRCLRLFSLFIETHDSNREVQHITSYNFQIIANVINKTYHSIP